MADLLTTEIIDKDRGGRLWIEPDLYSKTTLTGYVPNPNDIIFYPTTLLFKMVITVDYDYQTWTTKDLGSIENLNSDTVLGGHYPLRSDKYRFYVDTSKLPATMICDNAVTWNGPDVQGIRIFRAKNVSGDAEVLSGYYQNGQLLYNYLPMTNITDGDSELVVKQAMKGSCLAEVSHGEQVSFAVYADDGDIIAIGLGYIIKTNLTMALETPAKTVLGIKLRSPFILDPSSSIVTLPININLDSIQFTCEVQYSDGVKTFPIDGSRVTLNGLRNSGSHDTFYISSNAGNTLPLALSYQLAKGESYAGDDLVGDKIVKPYTAVTEVVDGAYSLKLFVIPVWLDASRGYRLQFLLYNLKRGVVYDATGYVTYTGGTTFDPVLYGIKQRLNVQVDCTKVTPLYRNNFVHAQSFNITLIKSGNQADTNTLLEYTPDGAVLGTNMWAKFKYTNVTYSTLDITCGYVTQGEWLKALYTNAQPLYDRRAESGPMEPTHFEVHVGGNIYTYAVSDWNSVKTVDFKIVDASSLVIRWLRRTPTDTFQLGATAMLTHKVE